MDTYIARPVLQFAYQRGAEALPRAWSKYTPGTTANAQQTARQQPAEAEAEQPRKDKKQKKKKAPAARRWCLQAAYEWTLPRLCLVCCLPNCCNVHIQQLSLLQVRMMSSCRSFLQVMQPRRKAAIWSNDMEAAASRRPGVQPQQVRWLCKYNEDRVLHTCTWQLHLAGPNWRSALAHPLISAHT